MTKYIGRLKIRHHLREGIVTGIGEVFVGSDTPPSILADGSVVSSVVLYCPLAVFWLPAVSVATAPPMYTITRPDPISTERIEIGSRRIDTVLSPGIHIEAVPKAVSPERIDPESELLLLQTQVDLEWQPDCPNTMADSIEANRQYSRTTLRSEVMTLLNKGSNGDPSPEHTAK